MKKYFLLPILILSIGFFFTACEDDDDDDDNTTPTQTNTGAGSGSGAGTGGGTGSGGIPPNSMKATVNGTVVSFATVFGTKTGNDIIITGLSSNTYPQLTITIADSIPKGDYNYPISPGEPYVLYSLNATTTYYPERGEFKLRTNDASQKLVNGKFNITMKNTADPTDSISVTNGEFNKFYN